MAAASVLLRRLACVSHSFAPIVALWFASNSVIGIYNIAKYSPGIFKVLTSCTCRAASDSFACIGAFISCYIAPHLQLLCGCAGACPKLLVQLLFAQPRWRLAKPVRRAAGYHRVQPLTCCACETRGRPSIQHV